jgi:hypothetical protein
MQDMTAPLLTLNVEDSAMRGQFTVTEQHFAPGELHMSRLSRASVIVAIDGPLTLQYRNDSLSWMAPQVHPVCIYLEEGQSHEMPYGAWVNMSAQGRMPVNGLVMSPRSWTSRLARWMKVGRLSGMSRASSF